MLNYSQVRSPLIEFVSDSLREPRPKNIGLELIERRFLSQLSLRGDTDNARFLDAVEGILGIPLPLRPNTFVENDRSTILWLSPNEWLIVSPEDEADLAGPLRKALDGMFSAVNDVTHSQSIIRVRGDRALDVMRKGCCLDLHPNVFGPSSCAQTLLAKAGITIRWVDGTPSFDLIVRRSFAEYLALWLKDAAEEYGFAVG